MKVGVTGTQGGGTVDQIARLQFMLRELGATEVHHGDCIGVDEQAHYMAQDLSIDIVVHPPTNNSKRAFTSGEKTTYRTPLPYLERNHVIVDEVEYLIVVPAEAHEKLRSGTWATFRYARKIGRPYTILAP